MCSKGKSSSAGSRRNGIGAREKYIACPRSVVTTFTTFGFVSLVSIGAGFALFGSVTYLPMFLQNVKNATPTISGLQMIPMMGGTLTAFSEGPGKGAKFILEIPLTLKTKTVKS